MTPFNVSDANVEFSVPSFMSEEESEVAEICITLNDDIEREIIITLSAIEQSEIKKSTLILYHYPRFFLSLSYSSRF